MENPGASMTGRYTSREYWEAYYQDAPVNRDLIERISREYDPIWQKLYTTVKGPKNTVLEIGGYPGRHLAYFSHRFGLSPTCLDFNPDADKVKAAFQAFGLQNGTILRTDFLEHAPPVQYDIVYSLGLVEHFENYDLMLDKHVDYLRPGGALLIMVPNKRYLRKWYGQLIDPKNLQLHNLNCMRKQVFAAFAARNHLLLRELAYFGSFPYKVHQNLNFPQKVIYELARSIARRTAAFQLRNPSCYYSANLYGIFQKPMGDESLDI